MALSRILLLSLVAVAALGFAVSQVQVGSAIPDNQCIGCICEAASGCNNTVGCHNGMCGMFRITFPYWVDAGKPIITGDNPEDSEAWKRCVNDPPCAGQTVINYVSKFAKDCNGDGVIDCVDFAWIHHLGGYGCGSRPLDVKYERQFTECLRSVQRLNANSQPNVNTQPIQAFA